MNPWIPALLGFGLAYTAGAHVLSRLWGGIRKGPPIPQVALTFDDGPHPVYTPRILEVLAEHGAGATFFLIGRHAEENPELVRRIVAEGHTLGSHTYAHRHLWHLDPWATREEILRGHRAVEAISGESLRFFRPPWGAMNLAALAVCSWEGLVPVLWSVRAEGYRWRPSWEEMAQVVVQRAHPGAIVNLHDRGGFPDTPERVLRALPRILAGLRARGLRPVTLAALLG
ncbi:MAG: polysaccharide deacetylase family protein [Armatimonadetes bacterium]|nr:polysaccharide deacetylase family protein [Armatimonadota bacterium]MDW8154335.1 polysaccharide deacetylase family protein [Armatimonadota bacterium]